MFYHTRIVIDRIVEMSTQTQNLVFYTIHYFTKTMNVSFMHPFKFRLSEISLLLLLTVKFGFRQPLWRVLLFG